MQAVPYSREFKQKYDYFRKKLKKPVIRESYPCVFGVLQKLSRMDLNLVQTQ